MLVSNHGKCPYGHPWVYVASRIGFCPEEVCQVAWLIIGSRNQKVYFELEGLQALMEGDITPEEITEREKLRDVNSRY
jgi:hypothetical protein